MYRTIDARFWSDPKVRKLSPHEKLLFLYLITNSHTHVSGIYNLPIATMVYELGVTKSIIGYGIDTLSAQKLVMFDQETDVVWVVKMLEYQGCGDKSNRAAAYHLFEDLHNCALTSEFLRVYPQVESHVKPDWRIRYRYPICAETQRATPKQEQEQEQEQEMNKSGELGDADSPPSASIVLTFPCASGKQWFLTSEKLKQYGESFPAVNVLAECRKALQWCRDNPKKIKTFEGMPKFLGSWLGRVQDRGGGTFGRSNGQLFAGPAAFAAEDDQ